MSLTARTVLIAGVPTALASRSETTALYLSYLEARRRGEVERPLLASSMNGQTIFECLRDPEVQALFRAFPLTSMDGQPAVMVSRRWAEPFKERVATTDLIHDVFAAGISMQLRHYLLGATPEVLELARRKLLEQHPGALIVGAHHGYISEGDLPAICEELVDLQAELLWICMGVPREQAIALKIASAAPQLGLIKTGGGVLDFVSGLKPRAPAVLQALGLEWLYRLALEPKRLGLRYLTSNPVALRYLASLKPTYVDVQMHQA